MVYDASGSGGGDLEMTVVDATVTVIRQSARGLLNRDGTVTLFGTVACREDLGWGIQSYDAHQIIRDRIVQGTGSGRISCSPTPQQWSYSITPSKQPFSWRVLFHNEAVVFVCIPGGFCHAVNVFGDVRLQPRGPRPGP
jgi:hypothetical protein